MTPPTDAAVAALERAAIESYLENGRVNGTTQLRALHAADWTLVRRSEQEALVAAIPEDPRCADHTLAGECHWCGAALDDGDSHDPTCRWVKARAAIEGRP